MAPLILEGDTLGQKHRHYNKLLNEVISERSSQEIQKIDYDVPDIDNLFKIDLASNNKNVDYIIEVLKYEDMLYVSRALNHSVWLITDKEYAHIINPDYLHSQLLQQMTTKAGNKLLQRIRLKLKDEKRVEEFFNYYKENNQLKVALKWIPNCSLSFIETIVAKHADEFSCNLMARLCKKSFTILEIYARQYRNNLRSVLSRCEFLLNNHAQEFLCILKAQENYNIPKFTYKYTQIIMKSCPEMILNNFEQFSSKINVPACAKRMKKEDIEFFLIEHSKNKNLKSWFTFGNIKHFIARMPSNGRFKFVKSIQNTCDRNTVRPLGIDDKDDIGGVQYYCATRCVPNLSNANIYRWYIFAPFETAFIDLKKLIRAESNPSERNAMFSVLISCARGNLDNIQIILQYYRDQHINEAFKFKNHFINVVLSKWNTHKFDNKTWSILNDIFCSMEVYSESQADVQTCLKHIIIYKVIRGENVPDIVENKFYFDNLRSFRSKLNEEEKNKVFSYLYQLKIQKIRNIAVEKESDFFECTVHVIHIMNLLVVWEKDLLNHVIIIEKIKELAKIKANKSWREDLSSIYNTKKSWRKHLFIASIIIQPIQITFVNALKHDPRILTVAQENISTYSPILRTTFLNKLRVYWPQSLAKTFEDCFLHQLNHTTEHKMAVEGLCILLPQKQLSNMLNKYKPNQAKINWSEADELPLNIQKQIGKYMCLARPPPHVEIVLSYAKGDYLQYGLPSVRSILSNMSFNRRYDYIHTLLDAPVSLQEHCLKFAFDTLKIDELLEKCQTVWKSNQNASIRATIFKIVFDSLCKEQNDTNIKEIWLVLSSFIDNLTSDENKTIYIALGEARKVPLSVKQAFCIKSYRYLKSLPAKTNCETIVNPVVSGTLDIMEAIDVDFVAEIVFDSFNEKFAQEYFMYTDLVSSCLLSTKSEPIQTQRFERIFVPLLNKYVELLKSSKKVFHLKYNFKSVLKQLHEDLQNIVLKKYMITPTKLYRDIYDNLEKNLSHEENYVLILTWKLAAEYIKIVDKYRLKDNDLLEDDNSKCSKSEFNRSDCNSLYLKTTSEFGRVCMEQLKVEINKCFPSIYKLFSKAVKELFDRLQFECKVQLATINSILLHADINEGYLLVLWLVPKDIDCQEDIEERSKIYEKLATHPSAEVRISYQHTVCEE